MTQKNEWKEKFLKSLADRWGAPIVTRHEVSKFSGGVLNPRTLANLDCQGKGPEGRFTVGKKVCYPVDSLINFMLAMQDGRGVA